MIAPRKADSLAPQHGGLLSSILSLGASSSTLLCCALPALLVALGAGATLSALVSVVPQLVWRSEHKLGLFLLAGGMLLTSSLLQWRARNAPCPSDPALRAACAGTRQIAWWITGLSLLTYLIGGWFAFVMPLLF